MTATAEDIARVFDVPLHLIDPDAPLTVEFDFPERPPLRGPVLSRECRRRIRARRLLLPGTMAVIRRLIDEQVLYGQAPPVISGCFKGYDEYRLT